MALDYHYFNLHKKCWSVMNRGKVIAHVAERYIENPVFVVRPAGQRKVRFERRKNVHAFVKGVSYDGIRAPRSAANLSRFGVTGPWWVEVSYNPYRPYFVDGVRATAPFFEKATGKAVHCAAWAVLTSDRKLFVRYF